MSSTNRRLLAAIPAVAMAILLSACEPKGETDMTADQTKENLAAMDQITELQIIDVVEGDGELASQGKLVVVHYTGWLYDPAADDKKGEQFDSSVERGDPFVFPLGEKWVIQGWDQGVDGMKTGGKRTLIIPPHLGYGERGAGAAIPPNATLLFDVELIAIQ